MMSNRSARFFLFFLFLVAVAGVIWYDLHRKKGGAEDLGMQAVTVCATSRDLQSGKHRCPTQPKQVTTCNDARVAVTTIDGIKLASQISQTPPPSTVAECELKTVNQKEGLYALLIHAYYLQTPTSPSPLSNDSLPNQASSQLYATYSNLYQSYLPIQPSTSPTPGFTTTSTYQPFTAAFLIKGEPGFRMQVILQDEHGTIKPGAGVHIKVSCGNASDIMTAEPTGNSWFSFDGYEKLHCGNQPLTAQVIVEKDSSDHWIPNTPGYSYLYDPADPQIVTFQNRPQPAQVTFTGKWQGVAVRVMVSSRKVDGTSQNLPLGNTTVRFGCDQPLSPAPPADQLIPLERQTDSSGQASMPLADAQLDFQDCIGNQFTAELANYDAKTGPQSKDDPNYDFYFANPGPLPAGRVNGTEIAQSLIQGQELELGGYVRLNDVGSTPGGFLGGNILCLFFDQNTATSTKGCPGDRTNNSITVKSDSSGQYLFGGDPVSRISYGDYLHQNQPKLLLRITTYKNEGYPADFVDKNNTSLDPHTFNQRDIHLPTTPQDLREHVCLAVVQTWASSRECDPLFNIIFHESGWNVAATNSSSGACGLFQSNPCEKYAQTAIPGEDYHAVGNQIRWGIRYVKDRYGTPSNAWAFWQAHSNY